MSNVRKHGLTNRMRQFADAYFKHGNATRAAMEVGYSEKAAHWHGFTLKNREEVQEYLRIKVENEVMTAHEWYKQSAAIARGSLEDFLDIQPDGTAKVNLNKAQAAGKMFLLKSYVDTPKSGLRIELHDPLVAMEKIGRALGLINRMDVTSGGKDLIPIDLLVEALRKADDETRTD